MAVKDSKTQKILKYLQNGWKIDNMTAFRTFGITRLGSVIHELRKRHNIETVMTESSDGVQHATYQYKGAASAREPETESERQKQDEYLAVRFK